ncbi:MAG: hypothetical protein H0T41_02250, partial [Rhodobacteraceae bacterium]|nr:hypothetical protein [Paracoccaceae bacterium]
TELPVEECDRLGALGGAEINAAKATLANEVTRLCHGAEAAAEAEATAQRLFSRDAVAPGAVVTVHVSVIAEPASGGLPTLTLRPEEIPAEGVSIVQLLVKSGLAGSGKDARRLIAEGGARLDDVALTDAGLHLDAAALSGTLKLSAGKKRHALVRLSG